MNRRSKKPPVTSADGSCPKGKSVFAVTVTETYSKTYVVYADDKEDAEWLVDRWLNEGKVDPTADKGASYDAAVNAEETVLHVVDLPPDGEIAWGGERFPYWDLEKDGETRRVAAYGLQKLLVSPDGAYEKPVRKTRALDETVAFYAGPEDTLDDVMKEVFG